MRTATVLVSLLVSCVCWSAAKPLVLVYQNDFELNSVVEGDTYTRVLLRNFHIEHAISVVRVLRLTTRTKLDDVSAITSNSVVLNIGDVDRIVPLINQILELLQHKVDSTWTLLTNKGPCQKHSTIRPEIIPSDSAPTATRAHNTQPNAYAQIGIVREAKGRIGNCDRTKSLEKQHLKAGTYDLPPFTSHGKTVENKTFWQGIEIDLFKTLCASLHLTYTMFQAPENNFILNNSKYNLVDMMKNKEVDIAATSLIYNGDRAQIFDLIWPSYFGYRIMVVPPPAVAYDLLSNVKPFQASVWGAIIFCLVLLSIIMWALARQLRMESEFSLGFLYNLSLMVGQGGFNPRNLHGRFLLCGWNLGAVVLVFGYTSIMISFITAPVADFPVKKFEDFVTKNALKPVSNRNLDLTVQFLRAKSGYEKQLGDILRKCSSCQVSTDDEAITKVLEGRNGFLTAQPIGEALLIKDFRSTGKCRLALRVPKDEILVFPGWYISKELKGLTEALKRKIMTAHETGITRYIYRNNLREIPCSLMVNLIPKYEESPLTIIQLQTAFAFLAIGWFASVAVFFTDFLRKRRHDLAQTLRM